MTSFRCAVLTAVLIGAGFEAHGATLVEDFLYRAQPRDTLIGLGRRLLLEPKRWRDVQSRNHIVDPRRIPDGQILRIPYDWLRVVRESATVSSIAGQVQVAGAAVQRGDVLPQGSVLITGADGSATISLADGSVVTLQKASVLKLDEMVQIAGVAAARSIRLKLDTGRVESVVKPHRDVGRFEIITPVAVSAVRGTQFRDSFNAADSHATAETLEGSVAVGGGADVIPVDAGFGTRVEQGKPPLPPVKLLPPPDLSGLPPVQSTPEFHVQLPAVAGAKQYRLQLSGEAQFHALLADVVTDDGAVTFASIPDGAYFLRARSVDGLGIEGLDAVRTIGRHVLPPPPQPTSPRAGAKITGSRLELSWSGAASSARFTVQVSGDPTFGSLVTERAALTAPSVVIDDLVPGRYFWRVAAVNGAGESGPWSEPETFTQRAASPEPDAPRLMGHELLFGWHEVPLASYQVQVARDVQFQHLLADQHRDTPDLTLAKPVPGVYFVRVQGIDAEGHADGFGPARKFYVPIPLWVKIVVPVSIGLALIL